jgi:hypothetical protein
MQSKKEERISLPFFVSTRFCNYLNVNCNRIGKNQKVVSIYDEKETDKTLVYLGIDVPSNIHEPFGD